MRRFFLSCASYRCHFLWRQNPAFDRAASLRHGINLSGWFASSGDLSQQHFDSFTTEADLKLIHAMGFDSVRLGIEPSLIVRHGQPHARESEALAALDRAVHQRSPITSP